jgi:hypothetical protein
MVLNQLPLLMLGGLSSGRSAFIDDDRFAAGKDNMAMVTANLLRDREGKLPASLNLPDGSPIPQYKHLQWGFFLGDIAGTPGSNLTHVHMGTWAAGRAADPSQLPTSGTASYSGHAIGNVANGGALYTAVGSFQNTWNFAQRAGTVNMNFDRAQYTGVTQLRSGSAVFEGNLTAPARTGSLIGNFVQPAAGGTAGTPPAGVVGRFGISESSGTPYRASGTFAAERTP